MSPQAGDDRPYVTITGDTHAGASIEMYRDYLDSALHEDFDRWRSTYRNPSKKHVGSKKNKNWDSAERRRGSRERWRGRPR